MAMKGDPGVPAHVVIFLRACTGMTQTELGRASRVNQAEISRYELGRSVPSDAVLRRLAAAAGIGWPLVVSLRQFLGSFLAAAERWDPAPDGPVLDLAVPEPAPRSAEEERREAAEIWGRLERFPVYWRRRLIELSPRSGSWALALQASEESLRQTAQRPEEALELADLALSMAERAPGEESWRSRLMGFCRVHVANARRVAGDPAGAAEALIRARDLWRAGTDPDGRLPEGRMSDLPLPG